MKITTYDVYRQLNRREKGAWTRLARTFSIAPGNKVWEGRLEERRKAKG